MLSIVPICPLLLPQMLGELVLRALGLPTGGTPHFDNVITPCRSEGCHPCEDEASVKQAHLRPGKQTGI